VQLGKLAVAMLEHAPYIVTRHPASRRQQLLARAGVDVVLDVGAAAGAYAGTLRAFGYRGRIVSFEPVAETFAALRARSAGDPLWDARNCALGDAAGTATISLAGDSSSLLPMGEAHRRAAPDVLVTGEQAVTVERLDDIAGEVIGAGTAPFLKLDTQGFERQVLAGAAATLPSVVGLQLELSFVELYRGSMLVDEAVSWAYGNGFVLVGIERGFIAPTGQALQADGIFLRRERVPG